MSHVWILKYIGPNIRIKETPFSDPFQFNTNSDIHSCDIQSHTVNWHFLESFTYEIQTKQNTINGLNIIGMVYAALTCNDVVMTFHDFIIIYKI